MKLAVFIYLFHFFLWIFTGILQCLPSLFVFVNYIYIIANEQKITHNACINVTPGGGGGGVRIGKGSGFDK